jgi:Trypsin-like peptidase domain/Effector-associated domain 1
MSIDLKGKGKQAEAFRDALLSGFPRYADLQQLALFDLDVTLESDVAPPTQPTSEVALALVMWAQRETRLDELLAGAIARRPKNPGLRRFAVEVSLTSTKPPDGRLEALVLPQEKWETAVDWRGQMAKLERSVCQVKVGNVVGTGFLVGPSTLLTNWHVVKQAGDGQGSGIRLDYTADAAPAALLPFHQNWLIDKSVEEELDYACVRVRDAVGREVVAGAGERGWVTPGTHEFKVGEVQLILQHPLNLSLKIGAGTVTAVNSLHKRVSYTTNTEVGSSGAPVFTLDWKPVALHHYGEATGNMGIPLGAIWQRLGENGRLADLAS